MPDASGTPSTNYLIPKFNTAVDPPSGKGTNTIVDFLDNLLKTTFIASPSGIVTGETPVWNTGTGTWVRSSATNIGPTSLGSGTPDSTKFLRGDGSWQTAGTSVPAGVIAPFGGSAAPTAWSLCDGSAISRTTFAALFAVIGTIYGVGDGSTTFNLPDIQGRVPVGKGTHADVSTLGNNDGLAAANRRPKHRHNHTLTLPDHTHNVTADRDGGSPNAYGSGSFGINSQTFASGGINSTPAINGGIGPQTGAEPVDSAAYIVFNYIIKQ